MHFSLPLLAYPGHWPWDGDHICFDTVVSSLRWVPGRPSHEKYAMDVRELLGIRHNALIRRLLPEIQAHGQTLYDFCEKPFSLCDREPGSYDKRAFAVRSFVENHIRYELRSEDLWQFPDETLFVEAGDCEDRAILLAALLSAVGISAYNVRIALGKVQLLDEKGQETEQGQHCWVMYKSETGRWLFLELDGTPCAAPAGSAPPPGTQRVTYEPVFLFNADHVWEMAKPDCQPRASLDCRWNSLHPTFFGEVHRSILHCALESIAPPPVLQKLNCFYTSLFGQIIDKPDLNPFAYDPLDHFDNSFIKESWESVQKRLSLFRSKALDDSAGSEAFAYAIHGIADFYAHSTYAHHAAKRGQAPAPFRPLAGSAWDAYPAENPILIGAAPFSVNRSLWKGTTAKARSYWKNKLISGRYGQIGDSHSLHEAPSFVPKKYVLQPNFAYRGALPHHEELALDRSQKTNALYPDPEEAQTQFQWRFEAACLHIRQAYLSHPQAGGTPCWP